MKKLNIYRNYSLSKSEMKQINGGRDWSCSCNSGGANPPYNSSWQAHYAMINEVAEAINKHCVSGGSCS